MSPYRMYLLRFAIFFSVWGSTMLYSTWINPHFNWYGFPAYEVVLQILPTHLWGLLLVAIGAGFGYHTAASKNMVQRNKQMILLSALAATVDTIWMIGLTVTLLRGDNSPLGPLLFFYCVFTHMIASKSQVRNLTTEQQLEMLRMESRE